MKKYKIVYQINSEHNFTTELNADCEDAAKRQIKAKYKGTGFEIKFLEIIEIDNAVEFLKNIFNIK